MAYRKIEDSKLTAIANAIRTKLIDTVTMTPDEMPGLIENIGIGVVPDYWKNYLVNKADEINTALNAAGENKSAFLWYTDAHWLSNYGKSPMLLKYLSKNTGMTKTFFGGDIAVNKSGEIEVLQTWKELVKDVPNHYSVIGNHDNQVSELPTAAECADFFIPRTGDMAMGTDATNGKMYYYIDNHIEKTRYICLSTGRMWTYADELTWCIDVLNNTPDGWHIVVVSHLWLNNDYDNGGIITTPERYTQVYLDLFDAYNYRESGTTEMHSVAYAFTNSKGKIEFVIGGHVHQDYDFTTAKGIPVILTECDAWQERDDVSVATQGTTTENCIYAVVANYASKTVKIINVGRGDTRIKSIPDVVTYTNQLSKSLTLDGTGIFGVDYNGDGTPDGYKRDTRTSSSGDTGATGWCVTGLIPAKVGDIIRFANMEYYDMSGDGGSTPRTTFFVYDASFNKLGNASHSPANPPEAGFKAVYGENGDVIQLTVPTNWSSATAYIRICCGDLNGDSVITVNEEIGSVDNEQPPEEEPETNNLLPSAIGFDGAVLNASTTPGYAADRRYSTSSNSLSSQSGIYATGLMPCAPTSTIYLENISSSAANNYCAIWLFDINDTNADGKAYLTKYTFADIATAPEDFGAVYDDNGTLIQMTLPDWQPTTTHFAVCSTEISAASIITVDKPIE